MTPEVLAPAGDEASLRAALAAGADAVYFGLDDGFNARARAANFSRAGLAQTVAQIHDAGARAYLTLNTLIFQPELQAVEAVVREAAAAGVDALIVQDPAVALLARALCPSMEVHASTQMTVSSPEGAAFCADLGVTRVVVPRELSVDEIRRFAAGTPLELEVFVHGALCMSWSGQCLTSEAWGGRSANRGQCAQACRLPYDLVVDDEVRDLGDVRYLLSPADLAGLPLVPELAKIGVHGLKIEGRQKGPVYVGAATVAYRHAVDALGGPAPDLSDDLRNLALGYSRGLSAGFLRGVDHQRLVEGRFPEHRGVYLGRVVRADGAEVVIRREAREGDQAPAALEVVPGMGVVFDQGRPHENEPGGPVFRVSAPRAGELTLGFGRPGPDLQQVCAGDRVFVTSDPGLAKRVEAAKRAVHRGVPVELAVSGGAGAPLVIRARSRGHRVDVVSTSRLAPAATRGLDAALLRDKLGALGDTRFTLAGLDTSGLGADLHLPVSELKSLRRGVVEALSAAMEAPRALSPGPALPGLLEEAAARAQAWGPAPEQPQLVPLVRNDAQLDVALALGFEEIELDWMEMVGLGRAVERVKAAGRRVVVATVRVHKPGEEGLDARVLRLRPHGVLIRHLGALITSSRMDPAERPVLHGDFSLNVTNSLSGQRLLDYGLSTVTASHDLDERQLHALVEAMPAHRVAVTLHHHIPTFHTEHCVYAHTLSKGRDYRTCGRPCEAQRVGLRDGKGRVHPVVVDVGCRNTVFNAEAQSAPALAARLVGAGVRRVRVELVWESARDAERVLAGWRELLSGQLTPAALLQRIGVHEQFGVTRGTMAVLGA